MAREQRAMGEPVRVLVPIFDPTVEADPRLVAPRGEITRGLLVGLLVASLGFLVGLLYP